MSNQYFPPLDGWEATKATLHAYCKVVGAVPRAHSVSHPKWWHISLKVQPDGLVTNDIQLPEGGIFFLKMNFQTHVVELVTSRGSQKSWSMSTGWTANQLAAKVFGAVADLGLEGEFSWKKFDNDEPRVYNPSHAGIYFAALVNADVLFKKHRAKLVGEIGPVQLWPHGFDLAFEWFGTRMIDYEAYGEKSSFPSQISLGFSPGEPNHPKPYFYSNPFPFEEEKLLQNPLPHGAIWYTKGWKGSLLEYASLVGVPNAEQKLLDYAMAVYVLASPDLMD